MADMGKTPNCEICGAAMRWRPDGWSCGTIEPKENRQCHGRIWHTEEMKRWVFVHLNNLRERIGEAIR